MIGLAQQTDAALTGVDGDPAILDAARTKAANVNAAVDFRKGLADCLPSPESPVDVVTATLLLHHLAPQAKQAALAEMYRVLAPGGRLVIADWGRPHDPLIRASFVVLQLADGLNRRETTPPAAFLAARRTTADRTNATRSGDITVSAHTIRYTVKPEEVARNEDLLKALFAELEELQTPGLRYAVFRLPDGVSYMHLVSHDKQSHGPLQRPQKIGEFHEGLHERCDEQPVRTSMIELGSFGWGED